MVYSLYTIHSPSIINKHNSIFRINSGGEKTMNTNGEINFFEITKIRVGRQPFLKLKKEKKENRGKQFSSHERF